MKRSTVTLPDHLAEALDAYVTAQEVPPSTSYNTAFSNRSCTSGIRRVFDRARLLAENAK